MPERYSHGHHESVLRSHRWRTAQNSASYLLPHLTSGSSLLDVGCGPGTITADLAGRLAPGRVVGLDAAPEIVAAAEQSAPGSAQLEFVVGDAYALPFADDTFDIVHAHQVLQHLADPVRALAEMRRVARPGGIVAARDVDYHGTVWFPELPGLARWMQLYQEVHRGNGGEPDAGRRLRSWAVAAGLRDIEATASLWVFSSSDDRAWWGGMWADRVLQSSFAQDALERGLASRAGLQEISDAWRLWATDDAAMLMMPHGEILCRA